MHQFLEDMQAKLNSDITDLEFDNIIRWAGEIIQVAKAKRKKPEITYQLFLQDKSNTALYGVLMNMIRQEIELIGNNNPKRLAELKALRNRAYQYKPWGYVPKGRSASLDT